MELRTLGGLGLAGAGFARVKPLLLLAYLALEGPKERRFLADLLWPRAANPRHSLSVALSQLRTALDAEPGGNDTRLWTQVECDAVKLREAAANEEWERVAELYQGPFLAGVELGPGMVELEEWLYQTRELLAQQAQAALIELAERGLRHGDRRAAARLAERAAALQADAAVNDGALLARLLELLTVTGNPRAKALQDEAATLGLAPPAEIANAPPARRATTHNLPNLPWAFYGRADELDDLTRLLDEGARLVTIVGFGGNGKTRLSLALARRLLNRSTYDQVYFVPLEDLSDPRRLLPLVVSTLSSAPGERDALSALRDRFGHERVLLVLDDLEQSGASPELLELLEVCPGTSVVVTAREPLGLQQETLYPLAGMPLPGTAAEALDEPGRYDGLGFYLHSARRFDPRFELTPDNLGAVLRVCRLVDGAPLGIELAAALARVIPVEEMARELESNLDLLVSTEPEPPARHASLRAIFERSWSMLDAAEQAALAGSAVFHGGFTRAAAQAVLGMDLLMLTALLDRSLIRRHRERYYLHPVVRQYAREKLAELPGADAVRARHAEHYFALLLSKRPFDRSAGQRVAFEELDRDYANLRVAWEWACTAGRGDLLEPAVRIMQRYLLTRGRVDEIYLLMELARASAGDAPLLAAKARLAQGRAQLRQDPLRARALIEESLQGLKRHGTDLDVASAFHALAMAYLTLDDDELARQYLLKALPALERHEDKELLGICLGNLGLLSDDREEQARWLRRATAANRRSGNTSDLVKVLEVTAMSLVADLGDYPGAIRLLDEAITKERDEIGRLDLLAYLHCEAAYCYVNLGDLTLAEEHSDAASRLLAERERRGDHRWDDRPLANWAVSHLHYARGDVERARAAAQAAAMETTSQKLLARIALEAGDALAAESHRQLHLDSVSPVTSRRVRLYAEIVSYLLRSDVVRLLLGPARGRDRRGAPPDGALMELLTALDRIVEFGFVPLALEAFNAAFALAPEVTGSRLLALAATHPAGRYYTRLRAQRLLDGLEVVQPPEGEPEPSQHAPEDGAEASPAELMALAADLGRRLRGAARPARVR